MTPLDKLRRLAASADLAPVISLTAAEAAETITRQQAALRDAIATAERLVDLIRPLVPLAPAIAGPLADLIVVIARARALARDVPPS